MKKNFKVFWKYRYLLHELVVKGIRLKYRKSYLGIIWSFIEPLMTTAVLVVVFGTLFNKFDDRTFAIYIMCGRLLFSFFSNATKSACKAVRKNAGMLKKVYVPKYLYPVSSVVYNYIIFLISLAVLIPVMIFARTLPTIHIWQIIPAVLELFLMVMGLGLILSVLDVMWRDTEYLWNVVSKTIMYLSAVFYPVERIEKSGFAWILSMNPIYCTIHQMRGGLMGFGVPVYEYFYPILVGGVLMIIGVVMFKNKQDTFILRL